MSEIKVGVIIGSTRPGSPANKVVEWYLKKVKDVSGLSFETIDLKEENLPFLDEAIPASMQQYQHEHTRKWAEKIAGYDAFVWVTPEYNHAPPAPLKNAIDYLFKEWNRKPVAFVGYGNMGGMRAIEQLRAIAGELEMADIRLAVGIRNPWDMLDKDGNIKEELVYGDPAAQAEQLLWWAEALKNAR